MCCLSQSRVYCLSQDKSPAGNEGTGSQAAPVCRFNGLSLNSVATNLKAGYNKERGLERVKEPGMVDSYKETLSSGHSRTVACVNSP